MPDPITDLLSMPDLITDLCYLYFAMRSCQYPGFLLACATAMTRMNWGSIEKIMEYGNLGMRQRLNGA